MHVRPAVGVGKDWIKNNFLLMCIEAKQLDTHSRKTSKQNILNCQIENIEIPQAGRVWAPDGAARQGRATELFSNKTIVYHSLHKAKKVGKDSENKREPTENQKQLLNSS